MVKRAPASSQVEVHGRTYDLSVQDGHVRVHLVGRVDAHRLTDYLMSEGYPLSHTAGEVTDAQGWGPDYEPQGYYPWWVYPDPDRPGGSCFAFNPRPDDVIEQGQSAVPSLSYDSQQDVARWVPILEQMVYGTDGVP